MMRKVNETAVLGGSFNPIHNGHIELAISAVDQFDIQKLLIMPVAGTYYKNEDMLAPASDRLNMVNIAIGSTKDPYRDILKASSLDIDRGGTTYTYDTINELSEVYDRIYFIIGMDSLMYIHKWIRADEFLPKCILLVADREGEYETDTDKQISFLEERYGAIIYRLKTKPHPYSSGMIRQMLQNGEDVSGFLPAGVYDYIRKQGLYTTGKGDKPYGS